MASPLFVPLCLVSVSFFFYAWHCAAVHGHTEYAYGARCYRAEHRALDTTVLAMLYELAAGHLFNLSSFRAAQCESAASFVPAGHTHMPDEAKDSSF